MNRILIICFLLLAGPCLGQRSLPKQLEFIDCRTDACLSETMGYLTLVKQGRSKKAIKQLHGRVLKDSRDMNALLLLGYIYDIVGDHDKAIHAYNAAVRANPDYTHAYFMKGNSYLKSGKYKAALHSFQGTINRDPLYYEAYNNMALIRLKNQGESGIVDNDYVLARRDLDRVMDKATSGDDRVFFNLGMVHANVRLYNDALSYFTRAIDNCADCGKSYFYRGLCNFYLRDYEAALNDIEESRALSHDDPRSEEVRSLLEDIVNFVEQN